MTMNERYRESFDEIMPEENLKNAIKDRAFHRRRKLPTAWAAALILVAALGSTTSVVAAVSHLPFFKAVTRENESGYTIQIKVERVDHEAFDGQIAEVRDIVLRQIENYRPWDSRMPNTVIKRFNSLEEGMDYVGVTDYYAVDRTLPATLDVLCNEQGEIRQILVTTDTKLWGNNVQIWYHIFSDLSADTDEVLLSSWTTEPTEFCSEAGTLKNGTQVRIVKAEDSVPMASGYFSEGPIVYFVHVAEAEGSSHSARETLEKALEMLTEP